MKAQEIVAKVKHLPPVSPAALKLVGLLDRPDVRNDDIVNILKYDSVLTGNVLRLCNSPLVGLAMPVTSVDQAVLVLGHRQLLRLVLALTFGSSISHPLPGYGVEASELWRHSLITALAAEMLAEDAQLSNLEPSVAFTGGLLHDLGKLVLHQALTPEVQTGIRARIEQGGLSRTDAERDILQTDHAEVGARILEQWQLPDVIVEAVANHHYPACKPRPRLSAIVHVANCLAHLIGSAPGWNGYAIHSDSEATRAIGVEADAIERLVIRVQDSVREVERLIEVE